MIWRTKRRRGPSNQSLANTKRLSSWRSSESQDIPSTQPATTLSISISLPRSRQSSLKCHRDWRNCLTLPMEASPGRKRNPGLTFETPTIAAALTLTYTRCGRHLQRLNVRSWFMQTYLRCTPLPQPLIGFVRLSKRNGVLLQEGCLASPMTWCASGQTPSL